MSIKIEEIQTALNGLVPASFAGFPVILIATLLLGLLAIYSYKIFRIALTVGGAIIFGALGSIVIAPFIIKFIPTPPVGIELEYAIGFAFALLGGCIMKFFFKVALFISGAGAGVVLGAPICAIIRGIFPTVELFNHQLGEWVVSGVCALILGIISLFLFKFIYIVSTSLGGMIGAVVLIVASIKPQAGNAAMMVAILIGLIAGTIAAINQYKTSETKSRRSEQEQ